MELFRLLFNPSSGHREIIGPSSSFNENVLSRSTFWWSFVELYVKRSLIFFLFVMNCVLIDGRFVCSVMKRMARKHVSHSIDIHVQYQTTETAKMQSCLRFKYLFKWLLFTVFFLFSAFNLIAFELAAEKIFIRIHASMFDKSRW